MDVDSANGQSSLQKSLNGASVVSIIAMRERGERGERGKEGRKKGRRQRKIYASFLSQKSNFHCCKALTAVAHAAPPRPTNPQYAIT